MDGSGDDAVIPAVTQQDAEFPYATIGELGLAIKAVRGREIVTEARRGGRKRRREDPDTPAGATPEATDAPT